MIDLLSLKRKKKKKKEIIKGPPTLSGGETSSARLWLARVMHSSNVLMKVEQVALSSDACTHKHTQAWFL